MTHQHMPPAGNRQKSQTLIIGIGVTVLVLAGAGVTWMLMMNKPAGPAATQPATATTPDPAALVLEGPAIEANAKDMLDLYKDKQTDAEAKYNGKVVDVTGTVFAKLDTTLDGSQVITLDGGTQGFAGVRCALHEKNNFQLRTVERGETVIIRGRCEGLTSSVILRDCAVLKKVP